MQKPADPASVTGAWPSAAEITALRAFHTGLDTRQAAARYLPESLAKGVSARAVLGRVRRKLLSQARLRHRADLERTLARAGRDRRLSSAGLQQAIDSLERTKTPAPQITDSISTWFPGRIARALEAHDIHTLADLTVRIPRLKGWWRSIDGLGAVSARSIETFFASHARLTDRARALVTLEQEALIPWERLRIPSEIDGSRGAFRAPRRTCVLTADNDYQAVQAWLELHESPMTQRAYRKEAERLILWAIIERGKALSSLTIEDAIAFRAFIRGPSPKHRWVGPVSPRSSPAWRPFQGALSPRSAAFALSVLNAMFRWMIEQRYVLANPFSGVRVRSASKVRSPGVRAFNETEWALIRLETSRLEALGWSGPAATRIRFVLDFSYATGLRSGELVGAKLVDIDVDEAGIRWINVVGKGSKAGRVAIPPLAGLALDRYLAARGLSTASATWPPATPLIASLLEDGRSLSGSRLWAILKLLFEQLAREITPKNQALADKMRRASAHWMRHTHATHALGRGVALTTVRDNLRHASIGTTSAYLHSDDSRRAREISGAFGLSPSIGTRSLRQKT